MPCANERATVEFMDEKRWANSAYFPICESVNVYKLAKRSTGERDRFPWRCRDCTKQLTVRTGTHYAESLIPLRRGSRAGWEASISKNGVSSEGVSRKCEPRYKSALCLMHRIRNAMAQDHDTSPKLTAASEAGKTYGGEEPRAMTGHNNGKHR